MGERWKGEERKGREGKRQREEREREKQEGVKRASKPDFEGIEEIQRRPEGMRSAGQESPREERADKGMAPAKRIKKI